MCVLYFKVAGRGKCSYQLCRVIEISTVLYLEKKKRRLSVLCITSKKTLL